MTKAEFLEKLSLELKRSNIADAADIMEEYEQHFTFKLADGYSEEEIAVKLGDPKDIAAQYDAVPAGKGGGKRVVAAIGLGITDVFFGILCVLLYSWVIVMVSGAFAFAATSIALIGDLGRFPHISVPEMPYGCAIILGVALLALSVLFAVGTKYFLAFVRQLICCFSRFHKNTLAAASGKPGWPSVPVFPQFSGKTKHVLRTVSVIVVIVFAVCFVAGFAACVIAAGSFEFWHTWNWFV